jgi:ribosomal protein L20
MSNLKSSNIALNRKMLAQLAVLDAPCLKKVVSLVTK